MTTAVKLSDDKLTANVFVSACFDADSSTVDSEAANGSYCYEVDKTWVENITNGLPIGCQGLAPANRSWAPEDKWIPFLNHKLASPFGVAAGPLLSSKWIELAASRGFDCVTYKTIRSHYHAGHGLPNILHLQVDDQLSASGPSCSQPLLTRTPAPNATACSAGSGGKISVPHSSSSAVGSGDMLAITNSFGMPSLGPQEAADDIRAAATSLRRGQMMFVSVTGTPGRPGLSFTEDLIQASRTALEGGATVLEVNLSCPNVGSSHVALYQDAPAVEATVAALAQAVGPVPLVLKVGAFPDTDCMRRMMAGAAAAGASAIAGINGLSRRVELPGGGGPALGPDRPTSGVCGDPIRAAGLDFVARARQVIAADSLDLGLVGVGGVTQAGHVMEYLRAGADVVQTATGFMWRPNLGLDFQRAWQQAGWELPRSDGRGGRD